MLSSRTEPQSVHTALPLAWSTSISEPPQVLHTRELMMEVEGQHSLEDRKEVHHLLTDPDTKQSPSHLIFQTLKVLTFPSLGIKTSEALVKGTLPPSQLQKRTSKCSYFNGGCFTWKHRQHWFNWLGFDHRSKSLRNQQHHNLSVCSLAYC